LFSIDIFPARTATDEDTFRIEIVIEAINRGIWDSTDDVDGQLRYRLCRPTRGAAEVIARELDAMCINAEVRVRFCGLGRSQGKRGSTPLRRRHHAVPALGT
jgi:hypothetical protein